ncbi:MAG: hypothetical protein AM326_00075 [Candidatus Thorarchaeota archaeon SMTZ-45]|nr:MAG: hypothetical protein AM326_00075 [Candidatus Thorarchaeota archaeon SMTZ-45]
MLEMNINKKVKLPRTLYTLCNKIMRISPWNIISIYLIGSLSTGEGTILKDGNTVHILSDYDLEVILRFYSPLFIRSASKLEEESSLKVKIGILPAFSLKNLKLIQMYELKKKGILLLGSKDILDQIPMEKPSDIPLLEGIRRLLNGIVEMIEAIRYDEVKNEISSEQIQTLNYSSSKAYLACCSALLTLIGEYRPSYRERCEIFKKVFRQKFKELNKVFPDFPEKVQRALNFKLQPSLSEFKQSSEEWFTSKDYIMATLEYYLSKYFSKTEYDLFSSLQDLQTLPIQPIFNLSYALNSLLFLKKIPPFKSFFTIPMISIQIAAVYLMCSISKNKSHDLEMLKKARDFVSMIYRTKDVSLHWNVLRDIIIKTWKIAPVYTSN